MTLKEYSSAQLSTLIEAAFAAIIVVDDNGTILLSNAKTNVLGLNSESTSGLMIDDILITPHGETKVWNKLKQLEKHDIIYVTGVKDTSVAPSASTYAASCTAIFWEKQHCRLVILQEGEPFQMLQDKLNHTTNLLNESQSIAKLGTWDWHIVNNTLDWSDQLFDIFGIAKDKFAASYEAFTGSIHPEDREKVDIAVKLSLEENKPYQVSHRIIKPDGSVRVIKEVGRVYRDERGDPIRMLGTAQDVTEEFLQQKALQEAHEEIANHHEELENLAYYDQLTGLTNRNYLLEYVPQLIASTDRNPQNFSLLLLDLDGFKDINDSQGHSEGDKVLQQVSRRLKDVLPKDATISRLGGDEFAIIFSSEDIAEIELHAERFLTSLQVRKKYDDVSFTITGSLGIARYPQDAEDVTQLIKNADFAMYQAKQAGKNQYQLYDESSAVNHKKRVQLISDLENALRLNQFELYYQPKIPTQKSDIIYVEALIRWRHPEKGFIPPDAFIPLAEDTGLIIEIGNWVLESVCRFIQSWKTVQSMEIKVAVNLSVKQLLQANQAEFIQKLTGQYAVKPQEIELEVTESAAMEDIELTRAMLLQLKNNAHTIAIDDFGTGYSSLNYLAKLPFDIIKIDRSFIRDILQIPENKAICQVVISLAHSLNKMVVAEGVETQEQADFLTQLGCDFMQGYLYAKPLPEQQLLDYVNSHLS